MAAYTEFGIGDDKTVHPDILEVVIFDEAVSQVSFFDTFRHCVIQAWDGRNRAGVSASTVSGMSCCIA